MARNGREARARRRAPYEPPIGRGRLERPEQKLPAADLGGESGTFDERDRATTADGRETRFVSWQDLERVADEASDIDSIVRSELEAVGERRAIDERSFTGSAPPPRRAVRGTRSAFGLVLVVFALSATLVIARNATGPDQPRATSAKASTTSPVPATTATPSPSSPAVVSPREIVARLSFSAPCWVDAVADGHRVFAGTISAGSRTVRATRTLQLTLGNGAGVDLLVDDRRVATGAPGEVVHLSFTLKDGKVEMTR
jgi:RodZ C-terminal domain